MCGHRRGVLLLAVLLAMQTHGTEVRDRALPGEQCFQLVQPGQNHLLPEEDGLSVEMFFRINCPDAPPAKVIRSYTATGNGTKGTIAWEGALSDAWEEMFAVNWQVEGDYEHWHCSGWRRWVWQLEREAGQDEEIIFSLRVDLLEHALDRVEEEAASFGRMPVVVQIGAMDGASHDHLNARMVRGAWKGLLVEPLGDYFEALKRAYANLTHVFRFENVAIAEDEVEREMHRVARGQVQDEEAAMGFDGSSSLLLAESGLPPGIAMVLEQRGKGPDYTDGVKSKIVSEKVRCARLGAVLARNDAEAMDLLAIDAEGYDLRILQQLDPLKSRPAVIFLEVGLLSVEDRREAVELLQSWGYKTNMCGYGMELIGTLRRS